jgi:uncharacterized protein YdcH (DUF465 family)
MNMPLQNHDVHSEFPEFKSVINTLRQHDAHFAKLAARYDEVTQRIRQVEIEAVPALSDEHLEELKKERLVLKDQLYSILSRQTA